ncbi:unnamed protein product [Vitrella brassicaformis CCMP3155]|uniref:Uncharacterized protein n=2 Tax=Vitrella brassicaformis TaxID=1169539 RepID=A0A0G4ERL1_VITBC|nr:unnamed protein product [Vitrella brassicaformis CCMP3155]|mmetsp:Transcript_37542/g.94177  ORF Transcript_37542/g.94177 Transcript_37542/m.94177 type:complete len:253 (+) Transcript_37542:114-872(+)|eukprot:CEM00417.1 unnamed protein product [Vitrella brassicaformis CCMP3155]
MAELSSVTALGSAVIAVGGASAVLGGASIAAAMCPLTPRFVPSQGKFHPYLGAVTNLDDRKNIAASVRRIYALDFRGPHDSLFDVYRHDVTFEDPSVCVTNRADLARVLALVKSACRTDVRSFVVVDQYQRGFLIDVDMIWHIRRDAFTKRAAEIVDSNDNGSDEQRPLPTAASAASQPTSSSASPFSPSRPSSALLSVPLPCSVWIQFDDEGKISLHREMWFGRRLLDLGPLTAFPREMLGKAAAALGERF